MSNKALSLEKVIEILVSSELKIKEIYENINMERMEFYNMRRGASNKKKEEAAQVLSDKFAHIIAKAMAKVTCNKNISKHLNAKMNY